QLDALKAAGTTRVLILPAYPQYSATTTASLFDAVYAWAGQVRNLPEFRFINHYHDDARYIAALAMSVQRYWRNQGRPDQLVMSFHGVPERTLHLGDPYHCECRKTARLLAEQLGLTPEQFKVTFQSRLGRAKWLEPYTEPSLIAMGKAGVQRVDVVCPSFTSDCLETLEEINMEGRAAFLQAGGKEFHLIPCLNDDPEWITALCDITQQHLAGWPTLVTSDAPQLAASRAQALALGAKE
uniref:ferrochelatase n=1 Tax=Rhodoferax sp. TaxID=50421 RepID=UPI00374C9DB3